MEKRYTLPVAIALVVGTVIGSGVFFKAEAVLTKTGGNLTVGILAFIIMGVVMIISACTFGAVAQSHEGVEGLDYQILLEADYLVNADESGYSRENILHMRDTVFQTKTGTALLESIYLK